MSEASTETSPAEPVTQAKRRSYSDEFKQNAVHLVVEEKYSFAAAANAVDVCEQSLRTWHSKLAPKPEPVGDDAGIERCGKRTNACVESSSGPRWSVPSWKRRRRTSRKTSCEVRLD